MRIPVGCWVIPALIIFCASCGPQPELADKSERLDAQIAELQKELDAVNEELAGKQNDVAGDYKLTESKLNAAKDEAMRLAGQLAQLRDEKESLENRFSKYRRDYPIN